MRELAVQAFVTLDGVMQAPGGPEEDASDGFSAGGWSVPYWDDVIAQNMTEAMGHPFEFVLGRKTYEIFAAHWPHSEDPGAEVINDATKHVASNTVTELEWAYSRLIVGDVAEGVGRLKQADGPELQVHGSANLIQTLLANDLVDEVRVLIYPVVIGSGKRLFGDGTIPRSFEVTDSKVSPSGVIIGTFRRAGEVEVGSFALDEPT
jgi:dihydrofolate reductase